MDQSEVNLAEWEDPANWSGPQLLSDYFSKRDSRVWVPKQLLRAGWTINFGQPAGMAWLAAIMMTIARAPIANWMILGGR
ncbi:MAG: hypothetical protein ACR2NU_01225 [Aeoliella sp.]